ncbi:MAG: GDSL-type esterase/lipase family protein, partial [Bacteroidota bacterium]
HSKFSISQQFSSAWQKHVVYGPQYNRSKSNYYGLLGDYHTFNFSGDAPSWTKETFTYSKSPSASPLQQKVERLKVLYRNPEAPVELSITTPQGPVVKTKIEASPELGIYTHDLEAPFENVQIGFASGTASPEVYGVALDCKTGISFDNVPLRGSSGIEFSRINSGHLKRQFEALGVKLLILQFGVNIVPNPLPDYTFYENMFYQQLKHLKSLAPDLDILVVGVSDMSYNLDGSYQSYPNIVKIRNAQKKAAFRAQCAFWDLYEAMGGENSMPSWVFAEPEPLANKDFTHFTGKGAAIVAEMLYKALILEYFKFNEVIN